MDREHVKSAADKARAASGKQPVRSRVFRSPLGDAPMSPPEAPTRSQFGWLDRDLFISR